jgi:hypothetical protein
MSGVLEFGEHGLPDDGTADLVEMGVQQEEPPIVIETQGKRLAREPATSSSLTLLLAVVVPLAMLVGALLTLLFMSIMNS